MFQCQVDYFSSVAFKASSLSWPNHVENVELKICKYAVYGGVRCLHLTVAGLGKVQDTGGQCALTVQVKKGGFASKQQIPNQVYISVDCIASARLCKGVALGDLGGKLQNVQCQVRGRPLRSHHGHGAAHNVIVHGAYTRRGARKYTLVQVQIGS